MSNNGQKQVSLAGAAGNPKAKKKQPFAWKPVAVIAGLVALVLVVVLLLPFIKGPSRFGGQ